MKKILLWTLFLPLTLVLTPGFLRSSALRIGPAMPQVVPEIVSFTANPPVIARGETVTLVWDTRGVPSVSLAWRPEYHRRGAKQQKTGLSPSGKMLFQPVENTVYVLQSEAPAGDLCLAASASVRVK